MTLEQEAMQRALEALEATAMSDDEMRRIVELSEKGISLWTPPKRPTVSNELLERLAASVKAKAASVQQQSCKIGFEYPGRA